MKLSELFNNWVKSSPVVLEREYNVEYKLKHLDDEYDDPFPTPQDFIDAYNSSPTVTVNSAMDRMIDNRSRTRSKDELIDLIKGYRSYPQYRNEQTVDDIYKGFQQNKQMEMPIVLSLPDHSMRVFSGNTRMDVAFQLGISPKVVVISI